MDYRTADLFRGCFLGGAVGDALGAAVEFTYSLSEIRARFGPAGLTGYAPVYGRRGAITDDTQMTLFTAEGLILAYERGREKGIWDPPSMVHAAYLRWLGTQGEVSSHPGFSPDLSFGLAALPDLQHRRAPGGTCLSALRSAVPGALDHPLNDSKGAGSIMRTAPVGLAFRQPFDPACRIAALTHSHPTGYLAAGAFAVVVAAVAEGASLEEGSAAAAAELPGRRGHEETLTALQAGLALAHQGAPSAEKVETLGGGWIAEEALAIGLYCALVAEDFRHGVLLAVNHGGDSDTTGTLTGQLLGLRDGVGAIPPQWLAGLELRDEIAALSDRFHACYPQPL